MRMLVVTQAVDVDDPVLGFFHGWLTAFAKEVESIIVICLYEGTHELPSNVTVLSLGKEKRESRIQYILNFVRYIVQMRKEYTHVFVHMNQEYILLGGLLWRLWGKRVALWRNHAKGSVLTRTAVFFSHVVFYTSPQSFTARFKKAHIMAVGIDTDFFKPDSSVVKKSNSILFLGRISPVKNVDILVEALHELKKQGISFTTTIAGASPPSEAAYETKIKGKVRAYGLKGSVVFMGAVSQKEALKLYREHELYVNLTPSGSMDKTIFEAMASGLQIVVVNHALKAIIGSDFIIDRLDSEEVAEKIAAALKHKNTYREYIVKEHGLEYLIQSIIMRF